MYYVQLKFQEQPTALHHRTSKITENYKQKNQTLKKGENITWSLKNMIGDSSTYLD